MLKNLLLTIFISSLAFLGRSEATEIPPREAQIDELLKLLEKPEPFRPITAEQVDQSRNSLQSSIKELDNQLSEIGEVQSNRWKAYLKWDELMTLLAEEKPSRSRLIEISQQFRKNHPGLEMKVFTDVRSAIIDFANTSYFGSESISKKVYDSRLRLIKTALENLKKGYDDRTLGLLGEATSDLDHSGNCPKLVAAIRGAFAKPNFHFEVSESLAKSILKEKTTYDTQSVDEVIVGVPQQGTANTTATFDVDFLPCAHSGRFKILINGTTISDQVGTKELGLLGSVYICSQGNTCLVGEAVIEFDGKQVSYSNLAAGARTNTNIKGVNSPPLLRNITMKQIQKKKSQGEAEAASKARAKFVRKVRSQLRESIGEANSKLNTKVNSTVRRLDFEPKRLELTTSSEAFRLLAIIGNEQQLTSLQGPDSNAKGDVISQVHESSINNGLQHLLGGRKIDIDEMRQLITSFGAKLPPAPADEKPLSITFPRVRPIQVNFDDQHVTTVISANEIQSGNTVVKDDLKITVRYAVSSTADSVTIARVDDVKIDFEGAYTNAKSIIESNIKPKLEKLFKKESKQFRLAEIEMPEGMEKAGLPAISKLAINDGWFSMELNMKSEGVAQRVPVKPLHSVPVVRSHRQAVPIRTAATDPASRKSFISDSSLRIQDGR